MKAHRSIIYIALNIVNHYVFVTFIKSLLILSFVALTVPALQGCSKQACTQDGSFTEMSPKSSVKLAVHLNSDTPIRSVDALVFNDDRLERIDSYQRFNDLSDRILQIGSCRGNKIIALCANSQWDKAKWREADTFNRLMEIKAELTKEERNFPVMSSVIHINAGSDTTGVRLERLSSIIRLNSICCDFSGRAYDGEGISDARIYLTNVSGICSITGEDFDKVETIINHGGLIRDDLESFNDTSLIISHLGTIGTTPAYPGVELLCYPNTTIYEGAGTPFTRLVIEGKIHDETWYWPININRDSRNDHLGIKRNMKYSYDIIITGKGTKDPDMPVTSDMAEVVSKVERWIEKDEYCVEF